MKTGLQSLLSGYPMPIPPRPDAKWDLYKVQLEQERFNRQLIDYLKTLTGAFTSINILNEITNINETNPVFGDICKLFVKCQNGVLMYDTGSVYAPSGAFNADKKWSVQENYTGGYTDGFLTTDGAWAVPSTGLSWISKRSDKSGGVDDVQYKTNVQVLSFVNRPTLSIVVEIAADQAINGIYVNGVSQGIVVVPDPGYNAMHQFTITGANFVSGNNEFIVVCPDVGVIQGMYLRVIRITW